jgi:hypothetical protein
VPELVTFDADRAESAPRQFIERGTADHAKPDHGNVELRHRPSFRLSARSPRLDRGWLCSNHHPDAASGSSVIPRAEPKGMLFSENRCTFLEIML